MLLFTFFQFLADGGCSVRAHHRRYYAATTPLLHLRKCLPTYAPFNCTRFHSGEFPICSCSFFFPSPLSMSGGVMLCVCICMCVYRHGCPRRPRAPTHPRVCVCPHMHVLARRHVAHSFRFMFACNCTYSFDHLLQPPFANLFCLVFSFFLPPPVVCDLKIFLVF